MTRYEFRGFDQADWEVELGIVIGKRTSYLDSIEDAKDSIAGYCVVNDVSERDFQLEKTGSGPRQVCETFNPAGPGCDADEIDDVLNLGLWLDVNNVRRQTGSTSEMIFNPYFIVHYLSQSSCSSRVISSTPYPPGVGMGLKPPVWLEVETLWNSVSRTGTQRQIIVGRDESLRIDRTARMRSAGYRPTDRRPGGVIIDVHRPRVRHRHRVLHRADAVPP